MRFKSLSILSAIAFCALIGVMGCSGNSSDRSRMERSKHMLDEHEYSSAINELEAQYRSEPQNKSVAVLLAQAHLGASGVEMFDFASGVFGAQGPRASLELMYEPVCDDREISKPQGYDFRCLAMRILRRLPHPDDPHLERARNVLRENFPVPAQTPTDVNFLAAFIELGSGFGRLKVLLKKSLVAEVKSKASSEPTQLPFDLMIHNLKHLLQELMQGAVRAKYSYGKISKYVVGFEGKPIVKINSESLIFNEDLNMPTLLRFAAAVVREEADTVNGELNHVIDQNVNNFGKGLVQILSNLDSTEFGDEGHKTIRVMFQFEKLINRLLLELANSGAQVAGEIDVFTVVWSKPPQILKSLGAAFQKSWDTETSEPLKDYFVSTKSQWNELNVLLHDWDEWATDKLEINQREALLRYFSELQKTDPHVFSLPKHIEAEKMLEWQNKLVERLDAELSSIIDGQRPGLPQFSFEQSQRGHELLIKTRAWIAANLWVL